MAKAAEARHAITSVTNHFREFALGTLGLILSEDEAHSAIVGFLSRYSYEILSLKHAGTALPSAPNAARPLDYAISKYVSSIAESHDQLDAFMTIVHGYMIAHAMLGPTERTPPQLFDGTTLYLDGPLLISLAGLDGPHAHKSIASLLAAAKDAGAVISTFSHCINEAQSLIEHTAAHFEIDPTANSVAWEARAKGLTRTDLLVASRSLPDCLVSNGVALPQVLLYAGDRQKKQGAIDEIAAYLRSHIAYRSGYAPITDARSVYDIYVLRRGSSAFSLERCRAVLVTSHVALARESREWHRRSCQPGAIPAVVTDFTLANSIWIKDPASSPNLHTNEVLAFAHSAVRPTAQFWRSVLAEATKLREGGEITEDDLIKVRALPHITDDAFKRALGDESQLDADVIKETLRRSKVVEAENTLLRERVASLESAAHDRDLQSRHPLQAEPALQPSSQSPVEHCVLVIHGINDTGQWERDAKEVLDAARPGIHCEVIGFKYMGPVDFLWGWTIRNGAYDTLLKSVNKLAMSYPGARISIVAHSFGTHLVGELLRRHPSARFHRIILSGAVLDMAFPWVDVAERFVQSEPHVPTVLNEIGIKDIWPVIAWWVNVRYGASGAYGFHVPHKVQQCEYHGGHSVFLDKTHMRQNWVPFLFEDKSGYPSAGRRTPVFVHRCLLCVKAHRVCAYVVSHAIWVLLLGVVGAVLSWRMLWGRV